MSTRDRARPDTGSRPQDTWPAWLERLEVGVPATLAVATVALVAVGLATLPADVRVLFGLEVPPVRAPRAAAAVFAVVLAVAAVVAARRWSWVAGGRTAAWNALGAAHGLGWFALLWQGQVLAHAGGTEPTLAVVTGRLLGVIALLLGSASAAVTVLRRSPEQPPQHRPALPAASVPDAARTAWASSARLGPDVLAIQLTTLLLLLQPLLPDLVRAPAPALPAWVAWAWLGLILSATALRARHLWVTVTLGPRGVRIRTGPLGTVEELAWDDIEQVDAIEAGMASGGWWVRRFPHREIVLRPGPALRIACHGRFRPLVVTVDHAEVGAAVAAGHLP